MRVVDKPTEVKLYVNPPRIQKPITFREYLFNLPNEKLAEYIVREVGEPEFDYDYNDDYVCIGTMTYYVTTDGEQFWHNGYEDAIKHQVKLLESEYKEEKENDIF